MLPSKILWHLNPAGVSREHVISVCLIDFKPLWRHYGLYILRKENEKKNDIARLVCQAIGFCTNNSFITFFIAALSDFGIAYFKHYIMLFLTNEIAKKAEITILPVRHTTLPELQAGASWVERNYPAKLLYIYIQGGRGSVARDSL